MLHTFLVVLHVFVCLFLILVILLQESKTGGAGIAFGGGASTTVFGGSAKGNFLTKLTTGFAIVFALTSVSLAYLSSQQESSGLMKLAHEAAAEHKAAEKAAEKAVQPAPGGGLNITTAPASAPAIHVTTSPPSAPPAAKPSPAAPANPAK